MFLHIYTDSIADAPASQMTKKCSGNLKGRNTYLEHSHHL